MSLETLFNEIMVKSETSFTSLIRDVCDGNLPLQSFEDLAKVTCKYKVGNVLNTNWMANFSVLMKFNKFSDKQIKIRLRQFDIYLHINKIKDITQVLLGIKEKNNLTGDYKFLENIAKSVILIYYLFKLHLQFRSNNIYQKIKIP